MTVNIKTRECHEKSSEKKVRNILLCYKDKDKKQINKQKNIQKQVL